METNNQYILSKSINSDKNAYIYFILVLIQMIFVFESLVTGYRWSKEFIAIVPFVFFGVCFVYAIFWKQKKINIGMLLFLLVIIISKLATSLIWNDFTADNILLILVVIEAFMIASILDANKYWDQFVNVMVVMCVYSWISTYIFLPLSLEKGFNIGTRFTNILGVPYYDYGFSFAQAWHGYMRNQGYFREPGVYQVFLLIAFIIAVFDKKQPIKQYITKFLILFITIITTASTAGIPCLIIILFGSYQSFELKKRKKANRIIFIAVLLMLMFFGNRLYEVFFERITYTLTQGNNTITYAVRLEGPMNIVNEIFTSPIKIIAGDSFVHGLRNVRELNVISKTDVTGTHLVFCLGFGLPIGIYTIYLLYKFCKKNCVTFGTTIFVFSGLLLSMQSQNLIYNSFLWVMMFQVINLQKHRIKSLYESKSMTINSKIVLSD
ncbi:MAG: hypothetical protein ACOX1G_04685 [bacterium]|jgi:hypothetical protein